ncbi:unnamed protein product [Acanthosepion pharaonis]|uniref:Uncharacterized protein n=1 Tax=Acanthosepion pharaonis TaxID=158019 RepID=A0A812DER2_ACAPH|nr:unnamed protein product [Sepia pharaonis]
MRLSVGSGGAEAVDHLGGEGLDLWFFSRSLRRRYSPMRRSRSGDVIVGDQDRRIDGDLRAEIALGLERAAGLALGDRPLQHRLVEFIADLLICPGLFVAEQIARPANIEVVTGQLEACAQRVEVDRPSAASPPPRHRRASSTGRRGRATDRAGPAETVGAVDDHRVGRGNVDAAFDDGGRYQHLELAVATSGRAARRHSEPQAPLSADIPRYLAGRRRAGCAPRGGRPAASGSPTVRAARHRHLQRARDRRRGQRQHMNVGLSAFNRSFVRHAEPLLLVDDDEAQPLELDILGEQRMGADDDVDIARGRAVALTFFASLAVTRRERRPILIGSLEPGRNCCNAGGRQGGRADHRTCIPAIAATSGAQRHPVLPKPTSPDDPAGPLACPRSGRPAHRRSPGPDRRFPLVREAVDECRIARAVGLRPLAGAQRAFGGGGDQLTRDLADALLHLRLATLPRLAAQTVERRPVPRPSHSGSGLRG